MMSAIISGHPPPNSQAKVGDIKSGHLGQVFDQTTKGKNPHRLVDEIVLKATRFTSECLSAFVFPS